MDINSRVPPSSLTEAAAGSPLNNFNSLVQTPFLQFRGKVDLSPASGSYIGAQFFPLDVGSDYPAASVVNIGPVSAFAIEFEDPVVLSGVADNLYDESAEIVVGLTTFSLITQISEYFIAAWIWPQSLEFPVVNTNPILPPQKLIIAYEGAPVTPAVRMRTGMGPGSDPTLSIRFPFVITVMPQPTFGAARISVPSPWCVPPFIAYGPNKGTHIFQNRGGFPSPQIMPFPRRFRAKTIEPSVLEPVNPTVDARIFGGPWTAHVMGATKGGAASGSWELEHLLSRRDISTFPYTPVSLASAGPVASASLHTPSGQLYDALRLTQTDATNVSATDLLLEFPNA